MERSAQEMARYPEVYAPSEIIFQDGSGGTVTEFIGPRAIANYTARKTGKRPYNRTRSLTIPTALPMAVRYSGNAASLDPHQDVILGPPPIGLARPRAMGRPSP